MAEFTVFISLLPAVIPSGLVQLTSSLWRRKKTLKESKRKQRTAALVTLLMTLSKCWRCFRWRKLSLTPHTVSLETWQGGSQGDSLSCLGLPCPGLSPCRQRWRRWGFLAVNWSSWWPWVWAPECRSRVRQCECDPGGWRSGDTRISRRCPSQWTACCTAPSAPSRRWWPCPCYCWCIARPPLLAVFSLSSLELSVLSDLI